MKESDKYIGVFDSGIGGLTVVKSIIDDIPGENIIYFGDTAHVPYGTRSKQQITEYVMNDVRFLNTFNIKAIVIACNTADSAAKTEVEKNYPDIPIFGVVEPASEKAAHITKNNRIGVIATNATIRSKAYEKAIKKYNPDAEVFSVACPLLVPLVEEGRFKTDDPVISEVVEEYLTPLKEKEIDTLVLGCTHYPLLHGVISAFISDKTEIISSSAAAAEHLKTELAELDLLNSGEKKPGKYFVSDNAEFFEQKANMFMGDSLDGKVEQVNIE